MHPTLTRRNRWALRSFETRCALRFAVARWSWAEAAHAVLASCAVLGGCHGAAHTAEFRARLTSTTAGQDRTADQAPDG